MDQLVYHGILATVGNTPLVRLHNLDADCGARVFAKLERFNPTGSIEDRAALSELMAPIRAGELVPGSAVVAEPPSANLAVSLAQVCRYFSFELHVVLDASATTDWHRAMMAAYGARVETAAGHLVARRADRIASTLPGAYRLGRVEKPESGIRGWPRPEGDLLGEIRAALPAEPDYVFCPTSSMTALRSCVTHIRAYRLAARVFAVDDAGQGERLADLPLGRTDRVVAVHDGDVVAGCRHLLTSEGILAGSSSGAVVAALARTSPLLDQDSVCVLVLPDGGDRYLDTVYADGRTDRELGAATGLWRAAAPGPALDPALDPAALDLDFEEGESTPC
jgi:cysteine synthase A